jgi:hypothetical protein
MPIGKLKALNVARMKTPGMYGDGGGLWLQVTSAGAKSWILRYWIAERDPATGGLIRDPKTKRGRGKSREMGLGSCATVSLEGARTLAQEYPPNCKISRADTLLLDVLVHLERGDGVAQHHSCRRAAADAPGGDGEGAETALLPAPFWVHHTRGIGPLRLALAGATRSGSAGVGSPVSRSAGEATPHPSGVNWNGN